MTRRIGDSASLCVNWFICAVPICMCASEMISKSGSFAPFLLSSCAVRVSWQQQTKLNRRGEQSAMRAIFAFASCLLINVVCSAGSEGSLRTLEVTDVSENSATLHWDSSAYRLAKGHLKVKSPSPGHTSSCR